jgi:UDP-GlcNAc3NAcA epimerase
MRIVSIVGARPQFIKAAVVWRALDTLPGVVHRLVHTGQHYDANMSAVFFDELAIPRPDCDLGIGSGPHGAQTGRMLAAIEEVLAADLPDWTLVYGDTNSTLAGALAAAKLHAPLAHVEAGLRSFNRRMPEEINRVLTDHASDLLLAPTQTAVEHLLGEGIPVRRVHLVGDVMLDAARFYGQRAAHHSRVLERIGIEPKRYVLATVHRPENTDDPARLLALFDGLSLVADELPVVVPLHPRTRAALAREGALDRLCGALTLVDPVGYLDMVMLEQCAAAIATDSGGVQKEAFFYEVPCVTLRAETEWVELVELGWARLQPPESPAAVARTVRAALGTRGQPGAPYGDAQAGARIAALLEGRPE